jgi:hypothetical protein
MAAASIAGKPGRATAFAAGVLAVAMNRGHPYSIFRVD